MRLGLTLDTQPDRSSPRTQSPKGRTVALVGARGFTLIELMFVIIVIGLLATLMMPNYRRQVFRAQAADVLGRVQAIAVAVKDYEADGNDVPGGPGPVGSPPAFLAPYVSSGLFQGPGGITYQLSGPVASGAPATVVIRAGSGAGDDQVLLAVATALGPRSFTLGAGQGVGVTLSN